MALKDGAATERLRLASAAGISEAAAVLLSGADLEYLAMQRATGGTVVGSGSDVAQQGNRADITATGESTYQAAGGKVTRIIGRGFTGATAAAAGGTGFTAFSVINDEVIQATTPAKDAGTYDLTVSHPDGTATKVNGIVYV